MDAAMAAVTNRVDGAPGARGRRAPGDRSAAQRAGALLARFRRTRKVVLWVAPIVVLVLLWQLATDVWLTQERLFPPPADVWSALRDLANNHGAISGTYGNALATFKRIIIAFLLSFVVGAGVGVVAGRKKLVFDLVSNPLWVMMAVPSVVWAFIFVVMLGTGDIVPIAALMALLVPNVLITVAEGTKSLSNELLEMADSYAATWPQRLREVYVPQLVPYLFAGARVSFSLAIKVSVVAEVIGVQKGIGYELDNWYTQTVLAPVVAWGIVLTAFGLIVDYLVFAPLERRMGRWRVADAELNIVQEVV
jgi:ABC-type nitrate/sulfonate/bicarbonate transport system permease component